MTPWGTLAGHHFVTADLELVMLVDHPGGA
jgi:hypothetical protein